MVRSAHYAFQTVSPGVTAAVSRPGGAGLSNSGIVDLGGGCLVFDTSLNPMAAADLLAAAKHRTGREPSVAANSHWHLDHILGNQVFAPSPIYATRVTREVLVRQRRKLLAELRPRTLAKDVRKLERMLEGARSPAARRYLRTIVNVNRALLEVAPRIRWTPPTRTFERRVRLPGTRAAELLSFGSGHTASDAVLFLPHERILFGGDLIVTGHHPNLTSGDPEHWRIVLARLAALRPEAIVPGHGPVGSAEAIDAMEEYLRTVIELAREKGPDEIPRPFRVWAWPDQFEENMKFLRARRAT
ncbi:MAG: MBL fold metallo-hydrolase [Thermoplasmata archaeon]